MDDRIYHDLESSRKILPDVEEVLKTLMGLHRSLELLEGIDIENENDDTHLEITINEMHMEFHRKMYSYHKCLRKLVALGAIVKDLDLGLVDFYSKHNGKEIMLCWAYGEKDISHWHHTNKGYESRQPISLLEKPRENQS